MSDAVTPDWIAFDEWIEVHKQSGKANAMSTAFLAGYAAASADTERLVRAAVEATRDLYAAGLCDLCLAHGAPTLVSETGRIYHDVNGQWQHCRAMTIRTIDAAAIIQRVMQEAKPQ